MPTIEFSPTDYPEEFWTRLLPDDDYRPRMQLRPGNAAGFWARSATAPVVLAERRQWSREYANRHLRFTATAAAALAECLEWLRENTGSDFADAESAATGLEPDWLLLENDGARGFPLLGGALIFPSGWSLEDRLGQPLADLHAPVPGLQQAMGSRISAFLSHLEPCQPWQRDNWGITANPELNHHPAGRWHARPGPESRLDHLWLRLEEQFLMLLPSGQAMLFAIRVSTHRLDHLLAAYPRLLPRLARALATMSDAMVEYKGLGETRLPLLRTLGVSS